MSNHNNSPLISSSDWLFAEQVLSRKRTLVEARADTKFREVLKDPRIPFSVQEDLLLLWEQHGPQPTCIRRSTFSLSKFLAERQRSRQQDDRAGEKSETDHADKVMAATANDSVTANETKDSGDMLSSEMGSLKIAG